MRRKEEGRDKWPLSVEAESFQDVTSVCEARQLRRLRGGQELNMFDCWRRAAGESEAQILSVCSQVRPHEGQLNSFYAHHMWSTCDTNKHRDNDTSISQPRSHTRITISTQSHITQ